ncbi:MAG: DUF1330 domain-containing protein [Saprospiraceae bacterium]|nr:DUF1330 domain-containing protein [Saprospiraceae bacterium]
MSAYIIVDVSILDKEEYKTYVSLTPAAIEAFGGKFIVRGGKTETLEGDWEPGRIVVLEFSDANQARSWWDSELYAPAKSIRQRAAKTQMILVEGV